MGGRGGKSRVTANSATNNTVTQTLNSNDKWGFKATDDADYHQLYNGSGYYNQQQFGIDTRVALQDYVASDATQNSLYSQAQALNYAMKNGAKLTANQQYMVDSMEEGMHNLGYNLTLTRYARTDFMQMLGVPNFSNMTPQQLSNALVGMKYTEGGFISTSYNNFAKAPASNPFTDKAVRIVYDAPADTRSLMPPKGGGGDLGEIILSPASNNTYEITSANFTGTQGRSQNNWYNQVEIHVTIHTS